MLLEVGLPFRALLSPTDAPLAGPERQQPKDAQIYALFICFSDLSGFHFLHNAWEWVGKSHVCLKDIFATVFSGSNSLATPLGILGTPSCGKLPHLSKTGPLSTQTQSRPLLPWPEADPGVYSSVGTYFSPEFRFSAPAATFCCHH